nr:MAG TPA: hypothetical protein [Bacteriophage sp.]
MTLITPLGEIVIPSPAVSLSYLASKALFILTRVLLIVSIFRVLDPTIPKVVFNTLSNVVIPKDFNPGISVVFTTTASAKVIGTNS